MTCVVGICSGRRVWMGGDSAGTDDSGGQQLLADPKVWVQGKILLGQAGSVRLGHLLRYHVTPPPVPRGMPTQEYVCSLWIEAVLKSMREHRVKFSVGDEVLVGLRGQLFKLQEDGSVISIKERWDAVGGAASTALGALHVTAHLSPRVRILKALEASEHYNSTVRKPFTVTYI